MGDPGPRAPRRTQGQEGAYLVLYALLAVAVFTMGAIVLDMTSLREDKRAAGLAADLAVTAGAALLDPAVPATVPLACQQAWDYFRANADDDDGAVVPPPCGNLSPALSTCDPAVPRPPVTGFAGPYRVEITNPVVDGSPLMRGEAGPGDTPQPANPAVDGAPCARLGVRIVRTRTLAFASVVGLGSGRVDVHAVARPTGGTSRVPSLVVTDPTACRTLVSASGGNLDVGGSTLPGIVYVASDGSDAASCAGQYVISTPSGNIRALTVAGVQGVIHSAALLGAYPGTAWSPADTASGRLSPVPSPPPPAPTPPTAFVKDRFNCTAPGCPAAANPIDALRTSLGGPGVPTVEPYVTYTAANFLVPPADICTLGPGDPAPVFGPVDNVFVPCPLFQVANNVTFPGNVVFAGGVEVLDGGCLAVRSTTCGAPVVSLLDRGVVYLRSGNFIKDGGARVVLSNTFVHLTGTSTTEGRFYAPAESGGTRQLTWTAPLSGDFKNLLLWTESAGVMRLGGHSTFAADGLVYAPNSTRFELVALASGTTAAMQLVAGRVEVVEDKTFTIAPVAGRAITEQRRDVRLVR